MFTCPKTETGSAPAIMAAVVLTLTACSSNDDSTPTNTGRSVAFVATGFEATGQIERFSIDDGDISTGSLPVADSSDLRVATDSTHVYQIGRFRLDTITKFDPANTAAPVFQYSVNGDEIAVNPYSIAFLNENKAYITRYGSDKVWIVNPNTEDEAGFKIGELDLSAYDTDAPQMAGAVIVNDRLFVLMQRLAGVSGFDPVQPGYVAVFDTATDTEMDTGQGSDGLLGIELNTLNAESIQYIPPLDEIMVVGRGNIFEQFNSVEGDPYQGGLETIDPVSFENDILLDDGTEDNNQGFIGEAVVVSASRGYLLTYAVSPPPEEIGLSTLRSFNPTTGLIDPEPVMDTLINQDLATLAVGPKNRLWVGIRSTTTPGFMLINTDDNSVDTQLVPTQLNPLNVVFMNLPAVE